MTPLSRELTLPTLRRSSRQFCQRRSNECHGLIGLQPDELFREPQHTVAEPSEHAILAGVRAAFERMHWAVDFEAGLTLTRKPLAAA
jgi:hypothetical protein